MPRTYGQDVVKHVYKSDRLGRILTQIKVAGVLVDKIHRHVALEDSLLVLKLQVECKNKFGEILA